MSASRVGFLLLLLGLAGLALLARCHEPERDPSAGECVRRGRVRHRLRPAVSWEWESSGDVVSGGEEVNVSLIIIIYYNVVIACYL